MAKFASLVTIFLTPLFMFAQYNINLIFKDMETQQELKGVEIYYLNNENKKIYIKKTDDFGYTSFTPENFNPGEIINIHYRKDPDYYENLQAYEIRLSSTATANNFHIFLKKNVLFINLIVSDPITSQGLSGVKATYYQKDNQQGAEFISNSRGLITLEIHTYRPGDELKIFLTPPQESDYPQLEVIKTIKSDLLENTFLIALEKKNTKSKSNNSNLTIETSQLIIDRAIKSKDGSMQGQQEALEYLINLGHEFSGTNFSGVNLAAGNYSKAVFSDAKFHGADLSRINANGASFERSGLRFAKIEQANLSRTNFSQSYAPFIKGAGANFEGANLSEASFFCADLRGANFRNAILKGAAFAMADLRGAIFDGADLSGAYLNGALVDSTTFISTIFFETDFRGTVADSFRMTEKQKEGVCQHVYENPLKKNLTTPSPPPVWQPLHWDVRLWVTAEDNSKFENDEIISSRYTFSNFSTRNLPFCKTAPTGPTKHNANFVGEHMLSVDYSYTTKLNRTEIYRGQIERHLNLLKQKLTVQRTFKGTNALQAQRLNQMRVNAENSTSHTKPYFNTDIILVLMKNSNSVDDKSINWNYLAHLRWYYESFLASAGTLFLKSYWDNFFPDNTTWFDLPLEKIDFYKKWTLKRAKKPIENLVINVPFNEIFNYKNKDYNLLRKLITNNFWEESFYYEQDLHLGSNPQSNFALQKKGIDNARLSLLPISYLPKSVYVFPKEINSYDVKLPEEMPNKPDCIELDLKIKKTEMTLDDNGKLIFLIHVEPFQLNTFIKNNKSWEYSFY